MPDYLLEIGTEELPADHVPEAQERLKSLMTSTLGQQNLNFQSIECFGTPRRLACRIKGLSPVQPTTQKQVKGPPLASSFAADGKPLPPASGFAQKQGIKLEALDRQEIAGVTYLVANLTIAGKPAADVLRQVVPQVIVQISGERPMRWGSSDLKFSRPIRWLVSLLDKEEVEITLEGLKSGRSSFGHRILSPGKVKIASCQTYVEDLRTAFVLVDSQQRRQIIEQQVKQAAGAVAGSARQLKGALLEEVVNITEWPSAVLGEFDKEYLDLPDTLIETVMVHHQRYFPVESQGESTNGRQRLLPYFVSVANNDRPESKTVIKRGNERVLKARLADGRFFYFDDRKLKLSARKEALAQLTFHEGLGSYLDKQERLMLSARSLAQALRLDARLAVCLERTLELCKLDLVTGLVRELPELQGYVGSWYAELEGEPPDVVTAIASHYAPRSTDDTIAGDMVGRLSAVVDKLDNLVSVFAIGKRPTGSSDPYILRRQAQGTIDILLDGLKDYAINLTALMEHLVDLLRPALESYKGRADAQAGLKDLREFLLQRVKLKLLDKGLKREIIEAVLSVGDPLEDLADVVTRCQCLQDLVDSKAGGELIRAGVRIGNILTSDSHCQLKAELLEDDAERSLWKEFQQEVDSPWCAGSSFKKPVGKDQYERLLALLSKIAPHVDKLFEAVMINDPDSAKRDNRHALLFQIDCYFKVVADFAALQPLLL